MSPVPPPPNQAPPGWYPVDDVSQRYWDGYEWTNDIAPLSSAPAPRERNGVTENDRMYALIMHLSGLVISFVVPLIMWLIKKEESPFIDFHGRQSMNLQLTVLLGIIISIPLFFVVIGFLLLPLVILLDIILSIVAAVKANNGEYYKIPLTIPFFS